MSNKKPPVMTVIQEKEIELKAKVLETKKKAETIIAEARKEATKLRREARDVGEKASKALISKGLAKAKADAKELQTSSKTTISELNSKSKKNFADAVDFVMVGVTKSNVSESQPSKVKSKTVTQITQKEVAPEPDKMTEAADGGTDAS